MSDTPDDSRSPADGLDDAEPTDLERRIVRGLDGELDEGEREVLARRLLRDPDAHRLMDEHTEADARAADALQAAFGPRGADARQQWRRLGERAADGIGGRWVGAAAAAAVALTLAGGYLAWRLAPRPGPSAGHTAAPPARPQPPAAEEPMPDALERWIWQVWELPGTEVLAAEAGEPAGSKVQEASGVVPVPLPAIQGPRLRRRAVERHLFSAPDETGDTIYLLGVDRVRTGVQAVETDL